MFIPKDKAAVLVIGDEILSGKTQDININWIARELALMGIPLGEARVVSDEESEIVAAVNALRAKYKYVFTTGGIGPTHDDVTSACVAAAFSLPIDVNPVARARLADRIGEDMMIPARVKMCMMPAGAVLIENQYDAICGFRLENVFVLAGIPRVMQSMFDHARPMLEAASPITSLGLRTKLKEGQIALALGDIQKAHPRVAIGSYPEFTDREGSVKLTVRGNDPAELATVLAEISAMVEAMGDTPEKLEI